MNYIIKTNLKGGWQTIKFNDYDQYIQKWQQLKENGDIYENEKPIVRFNQKGGNGSIYFLIKLLETIKPLIEGHDINKPYKDIKKKYNLVRVDVLGDGLCMFYAICGQLMGLQKQNLKNPPIELVNYIIYLRMKIIVIIQEINNKIKVYYNEFNEPNSKLKEEFKEFVYIENGKRKESKETILNMNKEQFETYVQKFISFDYDIRFEIFNKNRGKTHTEFMENICISEKLYCNDDQIIFEEMVSNIDFIKKTYNKDVLNDFLNWNTIFLSIRGWHDDFIKREVSSIEKISIYCETITDYIEKYYRDGTKGGGAKIYGDISELFIITKFFEQDLRIIVWNQDSVGGAYPELNNGLKNKTIYIYNTGIHYNMVLKDSSDIRGKKIR